MFWLALFLPRLPLDVFLRGSPESAPSAAVERERVVVGDDAAMAAGVAAGMKLASARALAPALQVFVRDPAREAAALESLACWAGAFTPQVSIAGGDGALLLEIGGCLRLFAGAAGLGPLAAGLPPVGDGPANGEMSAVAKLAGAGRLLALARAGCADQGFAVAAAIAPTPRAALWLARAAGAGGEAPVCLDAGGLAAHLAPLPPAAAGFDATARARLESFGVGRLGDLLALPRRGVARRLGPEAALALARALGEAPDPRPWFPFPERFAERLELAARVEAAERLLFAARRLVGSLCGWLAARAAGVDHCLLRLEHEASRPPTELRLAFAGATRDPERIGRVLRERLDRLVLAAPVEAVVLAADTVESLPGRASVLFRDDAAAPDGLDALLERLRARIGEERVHGIEAVADHRPERATRPTAASAAGRVPGGEAAGEQGGAPSASAAPVRPLWLLRAPEPLPESGGRPQRRGPLVLVAGPERIESGWWDDGEGDEGGKCGKSVEGGGAGAGDVRRDYFVARNDEGQWLWIFRDDAGWFLQGYFA